VSTAGARLALVPPAADAPAAPPFEALVRSSEAGRGRSMRARRVVFETWVAGCALLLASPLLAALGGEGWVVAMFVAGVFLLPGSGVALFCFTLLDRTRAAVRALVAAVAMLAATGALMGPARRVAVELYVAAHEEELDALASAIRTGFAATPREPRWVSVLQVLPDGNFGGRFRRLAVKRVIPVDGGLLFTSSMGMGYTLLYADGVPGPANDCRKPRIRLIGGRWYEQQCLDYVDD
jgi:hypothetical protein